MTPLPRFALALSLIMLPAATLMAQAQPADKAPAQRNRDRTANADRQDVDARLQQITKQLNHLEERMRQLTDRMAESQ